MQDYRSSKEQDLPKSKRLLRVDRQLGQQQAKLAALEKEQEEIEELLGAVQKRKKEVLEEKEHVQSEIDRLEIEIV
eukprot:4182550-Pyramimonas_sp.AAC.1